jgi:hypothetical protein
MSQPDILVYNSAPADFPYKFKIRKIDSTVENWKPRSRGLTEKG